MVWIYQDKIMRFLLAVVIYTTWKERKNTIRIVISGMGTLVGLSFVDHVMKLNIF